MSSYPETTITHVNDHEAMENRKAESEKHRNSEQESARSFPQQAKKSSDASTDFPPAAEKTQAQQKLDDYKESTSAAEDKSDHEATMETKEEAKARRATELRTALEASALASLLLKKGKLPTQTPAEVQSRLRANEKTRKSIENEKADNRFKVQNSENGSERESDCIGDKKDGRR